MHTRKSTTVKDRQENMFHEYVVYKLFYGLI